MLGKEEIDSPQGTQEKGRTELVRELLDFGPAEALQAKRKDWGLPASWMWDAGGGPKGQEFKDSEEFTGIEYHCYNPSDFKKMVKDTDFKPKKSFLLGKGGFGEVHRVLCNGRVVARKKTSLLVNWPHMNKREIHAMKRINHTHIAQIVGIYILEDDLYILSYPVAEMTLRQYMDIRDIVGESARAKNLIGGMGCLSNALAYLHSAGIKHKDIHDENILVLGGCVILCDFGGADISKSNLPHSMYFHGIGDARAWDVLCLGKVFEKIVLNIDGFFSSHEGHSIHQQAEPSKNESGPLSRSLSRRSRLDLERLFENMTADKESDRPTAAWVTQYLRFGHCLWAYTHEFDEISCNTCGDCCR